MPELFIEKNMCLKGRQEISGKPRNALKSPINFALEWNANILFAAFLPDIANENEANVEHDKTKVTMHVYRYRPTKLRLNHRID